MKKIKLEEGKDRENWKREDIELEGGKMQDPLLIHVVKSLGNSSSHCEKAARVQQQPSCIMTQSAQMR